MLNHKQCDAFLAVAETGSFDLAAEQLCITASAVTLRVQSLEKSLGHLLIVRERPCRPTQAGQSLLHYLQHSRLLEQSFIQNLTGHMNTSAFYQINIATNADSLATWLLPLLQSTLIEQKIVVHFQVDDQSQTHHLLEAGLVNACVTDESQAMKGCVAEYIGDMNYRFVATPNFALQWFKHVACWRTIHACTTSCNASTPARPIAARWRRAARTTTPTEPGSGLASGEIHRRPDAANTIR